VISPGQKLRDDGGPIAVASIGYGLGNGLRLELEGNYRNEHVRIKGGSGTPGQGGGNLLNYGPMFNALYDIDFGSPVVPYVGAGVGYGLTQMQNVQTNGAVTGTQFRLKNQVVGSVAAQAILGVGYNIAAIPGLAITGEYRFYSDIQNEKFKGATITAPVTNGSAKINTQFNHAILVGFRYAFGAAPAPAPVAPAPQLPPQTASRTYLVFFDWDRADLTARARQIIADAASATTKVAVTRIDVSGNADLSGTAQYNQALSLRRAEAVAAELVRDGVARSSIDIHAYGDSRPLVPTARGVREPQNRRVEIVLK
jgi:OOP family OmpA-OmpF porin